MSGTMENTLTSTLARHSGPTAKSRTGFDPPSSDERAVDEITPPALDVGHDPLHNLRLSDGRLVDAKNTLASHIGQSHNSSSDREYAVGSNHLSPGSDHTKSPGSATTSSPRVKSDNGATSTNHQAILAAHAVNEPPSYHNGHFSPQNVASHPTLARIHAPVSIQDTAVNTPHLAPTTQPWMTRLADASCTEFIVLKLKKWGQHKVSVTGVCLLFVIVILAIVLVLVFGLPNSPPSVDAASVNGPRAPSDATVSPMLPNVPGTPVPVSVAPMAANTVLPTIAPATSRAAQVTEYINRITLAGREIAYPVSSGEFAQPEELALQWLIEQDSLQLIPDTPANQFRLKQRYALKTLWVQRNKLEPFFGSTGDECEWDGVSCQSMSLDGNIQVVNGLMPIEDNWNGHIPSDFGLLSSMLRFDLSSSSGMAGTIPESIGMWSNLESFAVWGNSFTGQLPDSIGNWSNLKYFYVSNNQLTGTLPSFIGAWTKIEYFDANTNFFIGTIPLSVGNWTNLVYVSFGNNSFEGSLPETIGFWKNLDVLIARNNSFDGTLPETLEALTALTNFDIGMNAISGSLPEFIGSWTKLTSFLAYETSLSSSLPEGIRLLTNLEIFYATFNSLTGTLPDSIGALTNLQRFQVHGNELTGTLPESIGQWTDLWAFSVQGNSLTGTIPASMANWTSLAEAFLDDTLLEGEVPSSVCSALDLSVISVDCDKVNCSCTTCFCD